MISERNKRKMEYINKYALSHYKQFTTKLPIEEYNKINELLKSINMSKADFLRFAYKELTGVNND